MKKILFGLGSITTITTPIILIACGSSGLSLNQIKAAAKERIDKSKLSDEQKNKLDNELDLTNDKQIYENILDEFETLLATHTQVAPYVVHHVQIIKPTKDDFSITVNGISYFIKKGSKSLVFKDFSNKTITLNIQNGKMLLYILFRKL